MGARHKDVEWQITSANVNGTLSYEAAQLAVLMDIRDELKALNSKLACYRIQRMLSTIERVDRRLAKKFKLK